MFVTGAYGEVVEAFDHLHNRKVAIKRIDGLFDVFENGKRIYREVAILKQLDHESIIKVHHIVMPK